jgi:hypothetical protein
MKKSKLLTQFIHAERKKKEEKVLLREKEKTGTLQY